MCDENELLKKAVTYIMSLVAKREYSISDLTNKLMSKYENQIVDSAINYAIEHNYVSDERYSEMFVRYRANNYYGPKKIYYELKLKRINENIISSAIENCGISFEERAKEYFDRKFADSDLNDRKLKEKAYRSMINRGYTNEQVTFCFITMDSHQE